MIGAHSHRWIGVAAILVVGMSACSIAPEIDRAPKRPQDISKVPNAVPRVEPKSRYGNPASYEVFGKRYHTLETSDGFVEQGIASWYGEKFHGRRTSSGEPYDMYAMTAAHKRLPLPTYVQVTNLRNNRTIIVRVNDRGPFHDNRVIDLSYTAASKLDMLGAGTAFVEVRAIDPRRPQAVAGPPPAVTPSTLPRVYLQVGAFAQRSNAERMLGDMNRVARNSVRIEEANYGGQPLFRVQLGPLTDVQQADRLAAALAADGIVDPLIVVD